MNLKTDRSRLLSAFEKRFGSAQHVFAASAPGRCNLIGEHTDYNAGLVLPMAVNRHTVVLFRASTGSKAPCIRVYSDVIDSSDEFGLNGIKATPDPKQNWANYIRGTAWALSKRGIKLKGGDLYITGDLPRGAGLSSSAALEIACGLALLSLAGKTMDSQKLAFAAQEAEHRFAGVRCGIMDQTVVARAKAGHALLLDCESMAVKHVPLSVRGYSFAIFDTGVRHKLASSEYNKRRAECEHAAHIMKKKNLRGVSIHEVLQYSNALTSNENKRIRHVLTENLRVAQFASALTRGDVPELGRLLNASHLSLSLDYEVSCKQLDAVVAELSKQNGRDGACPGARMTGGGFGGAVVALLKTSAFPKYARALASFAKGGSLLLSPAQGATDIKLGSHY